MIRGPENTPYYGGYYHGKLVFPSDYPYKPPRIYMITPNGRFKTNSRLCLSISDYHPDTWKPAWSVSTILTGLLSFMVNYTCEAAILCSHALIYIVSFTFIPSWRTAERWVVWKPQRRKNGSLPKRAWSSTSRTRSSLNYFRSVCR